MCHLINAMECVMSEKNLLMFTVILVLWLCSWEYYFDFTREKYIGGKLPMSHCLLKPVPQHDIARINLKIIVGEQLRMTKGGKQCDEVFHYVENGT